MQVYSTCPGIAGTHFDDSLGIEQRLDYLVAHTTLDEQIGQLTNKAPKLSALGIPAYNWLDDDQHGVARTSAYATVLPNGCGMGATWSKESGRSALPPFFFGRPTSVARSHKDTTDMGNFLPYKRNWGVWSTVPRHEAFTAVSLIRETAEAHATVAGSQSTARTSTSFEIRGIKKKYNPAIIRAVPFPFLMYIVACNQSSKSHGLDFARP